MNDIFATKAKLIDQLLESLHLGDSESLREVCKTLDVEEHITVGHFPPDIFKVFMDIFHHREQLASVESSPLFLLLYMNFESMTEQQEQILLPALAGVYPTLKDWYACFTISELIGEKYANEAGLQVTEKLLETVSGVPRRFLPHMLEHIAVASEPSIASLAHKHLEGLAFDPQEDVREEAIISLDRIKDENISRPASAERRTILARDLEMAISSRDANMLAEVCDALFCERHIAVYAFPDDIFEQILNAFDEPGISQRLNLEPIIDLLAVGIKALGDVHKSRLLTSLTSVCESITDYAQCYLVSDFIGRRYPSEDGIAVADQLKSSSNPVAKRYLPHLLEQIVWNSEGLVCTQALERLVLLQAHETSEICQDANESVARIMHANPGLRMAPESSSG